MQPLEPHYALYPTCLLLCLILAKYFPLYSKKISQTPIGLKALQLIKGRKTAEEKTFPVNELPDTVLAANKIIAPTLSELELPPNKIKEIEDKAMELVKIYEVTQGRKVDDVSMCYAGHDLKSYGEAEFRAIEVKGKAREGEIVLTANEWESAKVLEDEYYLYIVEHVLSDTPRLKIIRNPYKKLFPKANKMQFILPRKHYFPSSHMIRFKRFS